MKKTLLYLTSIMLFSTLFINAQTSKVWNFGADATNWPTSPSNSPVYVTTNTVVDNLGLFPGSGIATFGTVTTSNTTFTADSFAATACLKLGGAGLPSTPGNGGYLDPNNNFLPTQRYLYFAVTGPCTVKVWFKTSSTGNSRSLLVTDGISFKAFATTAADALLTANYTGSAGKLYLYTDTGANIYKIEVIASGSTGLGTTTLGNKSFQKESDVVVYANDGKINLSNIKSSTKVEVYNVLGALVQSAQADADTTLAINSGVYIVKAQSADGQKTVKVIVQ